MHKPTSYSKRIADFWRNTYKATSSSFSYAFKLPLARIKRLMKVEEDIKMVAAEVPVIFSLITEIFIQELTIRAWMCTEEGKRKILQPSDIGFAVKTSSMYDFLGVALNNIYNTEGIISMEQDTRGSVFMQSFPFMQEEQEINE